MFDHCWVVHHSYAEIDHERFSVVILSFQLILEGSFW